MLISEMVGPGEIVVLGLLYFFSELFYLIGIKNDAVFIIGLVIIIVQPGGESYRLHPLVVLSASHTEQRIGHTQHDRFQQMFLATLIVGIQRGINVINFSFFLGFCRNNDEQKRDKVS